MNYVIFDLEWNQCPQGKARENPRLPFEIVEIGAIKLNENMEEIGSFHELIRPLVYHRINRKTKEVIHIEASELAHKRTFSPVVRDFLAWCGDDFEFVTWGNLDLSELQRNMDYYRIRNTLPMPLFYYDLQKMFSILYDDGKSRSSLEDAVEFLKIPKDHDFHRAFDDTYYTAEIMKRMDMGAVCRYESVDYHRLPQDREAEIEMDFGTYRKYVSRAFETKEEMLADKKVNAMRCVRCGLPVFKRVRWFSAGSNMYLTLVHCPRHGFTKGKIRIKKNNEGQYFAVKTIKAADAESAASIRERQEAVKTKRRERRHRKSDGGHGDGGAGMFLIMLLLSMLLFAAPGRIIASGADQETPAAVQEVQSETEQAVQTEVQTPETQAESQSETQAETQAEPDVPAFTESDISLGLGMKHALKTQHIPEGVSITDYKSAAPEIVSVNEKGTLTALRPGKTMVTGYLSDGMVIAANVTVKEAAISKNKMKILKGDQKELKIKGTSALGSWKSSDKKIVKVSVDKTAGKVTVNAKKYGSAVITAKAGSMEFKCEVTVVDPALNRTEITLLKGDTFRLKGKKYTGKAEWSVKNSEVASVSGKGLVRALKKGKTTVYFKANGVTLKCKVVVADGGVSEPEISIQEGASMSAPLKGKSAPSGFSSSNESIATVGADGTVYAGQSGEALIKVHYGESTRSFYVTVPKAGASDTFADTSVLRTSGIASLRDYVAGSESKYRFMQGSCTDGTYGYFILTENYGNACALVKVDLSDWSIVKMRTGLPLGHGNDLTYDSKKKQLIAVHCEYKGNGEGKNISYISPKSLKVKKKKALDVKVYGAAYNPKSDCFAFGVSDTDTVVIKNRKMKTEREFPILHKGSYTRQGIDADSKYIYILQSNMSGSRTRVMVYTWKGVYMTTVHINGRREAESIFHVGNKFYIPSNNSSYDGGQIYETSLKHYYQVRYESGYSSKAVRYKMIRTGKGFVTAKNKFKREGYKFKGYKAFRASDATVCCRNKKNKKIKWFDANAIPDGYSRYIIPAKKKLKAMSKTPGDCIIMTAVWEEIIEEIDDGDVVG